MKTPILKSANELVVGDKVISFIFNGSVQISTISSICPFTETISKSLMSETIVYKRFIIQPVGIVCEDEQFLVVS